ncbi:MAG: GNAT family N-acetyltransferase [Verrucomicrobia bacterium]|nr:GNAT family N-acetyltransferase [Verrucomicrobiota bacterium]NBU07615.1 GNAT family N-acetyltransferase [Pseudomonadota bacterium]NDA66342.1 GNAT family N-acetyltransferase [Verrucomicrobiota bacterium]NDB75234.1 GNAT family N-acetyltransferase [Verrucomicrobiota bacterium]NDD38040.1 GNAT family N-acetyltransferase [Verrucomicrobiota bacterium]
MISLSQISVVPIISECERQEALQVLRATYEHEKGWVTDGDQVFSPDDLDRFGVAWFLARRGREPVGVLRVMFNPPLEVYAQYGFSPVPGGVKFDVTQFVKRSRVAEIGRFAVLPAHRKNHYIAAALMRAAARDTLERGFTHYVTDIFEGEQHSPYLFHTRVMGFEPVATHDVGELNCSHRRITMVLDLQSAYLRLRRSGGWLFRYLTADWSEALHRRLAGEATVLREDISVPHFAEAVLI